MSCPPPPLPGAFWRGFAWVVLFDAAAAVLVAAVVLGIGAGVVAASAASPLHDSLNVGTIQTPAEMTSSRGPYVFNAARSCRQIGAWTAPIWHTSEPGSRRCAPMAKRLTSGIETSPMQRWPIDRVALRVVQPGIHYTPNGLKTFLADFEGESPPAVNVPADTQDLTGLSIGQLVVVRYLGDNIERGRNKRYSRWLVRCLCGAYEHRKGASLRRVASSADSEADRCWECQNLRKLRGLKLSQPDDWQVNPISTVALLPGANEVFAGGERFGRLTVIGYGGSNRSRQGARWVVRCDCGLYGLMSAAGLKRGNSPQQCTICFQAQMGGKP